MILPDYELQIWAQDGGIDADSYDPANINPASIDLRFSGRVINLSTGDEHTVGKLSIEPGDAVLVDTLEYITMPLDCAGTLYLKSSLARIGLDHALAGWVDPNFSGTLTLELHAHRPIVIEKGQRIVQLVLQRMEGRPVQLYRGKYQHQYGPTEAR